MINQKFDYLYAENGRLKAVVVDKNGEPQVTDVTPDKPYSQSLITDGQGDTLVVSKKGQVMGVKEYKFAGDDRHLLNEYHRQLDSLGEWQINFNSAKEKQIYAFDQIGSGNHGIFATDEYYPKSGNYDFRYKSVECGQNDKVIVDYGSYPDRDSVIFKDKYGVKLKVVDGNILSFTGVSKADTNYIYAYRGDKKIGKLFLNTYQRKIYNVVLVSVNEAKILHEKNVDKAVKKVEESLNKVYNQCAVSFKISHTTIFIDDLTTFSHGGSGILSVYNEDQKKVLRAFDNQMTDGVYYLFFVDNVTDKKDGNGTSVSGYMPRGYNAGFIYDGGSPHTIAHELGHGIAGLEHVFENSSNSGKTANLMDYASGSELWHFQWDQIQDPSRVWMKWNKDESEGEKSFYDCIVLTEDLKQIRDFRFSDGLHTIHLPDEVYVSGFIVRNDEVSKTPLGTLAVISDGVYDYPIQYTNVAKFGYKSENVFKVKYDLTNSLTQTDSENIVDVLFKDNSLMVNNIKLETRKCHIPESEIYKTLYTEMSDEDYQEAVNLLVSRLNKQVDNQNFFAVDGDADQSNEAKDYRDRFGVFNSETGNSIYVDVCWFNKKPTAEQIANMAKDVYENEKSKLKNDDKSIYLVLPVWSEHKIKNDLRSYDKQMFARSLYTKSQKYSGITKTQEYKSATGNPIDIIDNVYRLVPKPYKLMSYAITYDANILQYPLQQSPSDIIGKSNIYEFELLVDDKLEEYLRFESNIQSLGEQIKRENQYNNGPKIPSYFKNRYDKEIEDFKAFVTEINNSNDYNYSDITHGFFESAIISQENNKPIPLLFAEAYLKNKRAQEVNWLSDKYFIKGVCEIEYQSVKGRIEKISLLLMPFGIDFVTDAIGAIYSGYYGDTETMTVYIIALTIEGVSATVLLKVLEHSSVVNKVTKKIEQRSTKPHNVPDNKIIVDASDPEKMMKNILSDVRGKRIIGNVEMDYDDLFREYFKHLDAETLAKFDKQMLNSWHAMMQKEMPEAWCRDITIVERFNNPEEKLFQCWDDLQSYTNKPEILLKDFDKFAEFKKKMSYTFKRMNELNAPTHWLVDYDYIKAFNKHHERGCEFLQALSDNKIIIDDFDSFMLFVEYPEKYAVNIISFDNIGQTMYFVDRKLTDKVIKEYTRILKNNPKLPVDKFRAMIGDFEHIDNFSNFKVRDIEDLCGYVHENEVRKILEQKILKVRSSGKYLAKDKIKAFVSGCLSTAVSKFILWRCKEENMNKDWTVFFDSITTKITDPNSYAFDFWGDMLKDGLANTVKNKKPFLGCLTNTDFSKFYLGIQGEDLYNDLWKQAINCFVGYVIDVAKNSSFVKEEVLTAVFNGGTKMKLWTQPLEDLITDMIKDNVLYPD